ncbi:MAG: glycoside hydrolase family protein [Armatimonadota bacterium]
MICGVQAASVEDAISLYQPKGQYSWDYWFAKDGDTYYAYYLQDPIGSPTLGESMTVGLATSKDLLHWTEYGTVLAPNPKGQWNDKCIATGSVWRHKDRWLMIFTGHTFTGEFGMGLAESKDLKHWMRIGDGPVKINYKPFVVPEDPYWQEKGFAAGSKLTYSLAADPYVLPKPIDGWYYMAGNSFLDGVPNEKKGVISLMRSKDGREWEDLGLISCPMVFERMETPQLWKHGKRWYLYFGSALGEARSNHVYTSDKMTGPFIANPKSEIHLPDGHWFYIAKIFAAPNGKDVLLGTVHPEVKLSHPYAVRYNADGSLGLTSIVKAEDK